MNKKKIAGTRQELRIKQERSDVRNSLLLCAAVVIAINLICQFLLTPFYRFLGDCAYSLSVDIERSGGVVQVMCEAGANVFFYLSSFLGTVAFFVGAAFVARFAKIKKVSKSIAASFILMLGMSVPTITTLVVFAVKKMNEAARVYRRRIRYHIRGRIFADSCCRRSRNISSAFMQSTKGRLTPVCSAVCGFHVFVRCGT